jgi:hypothetical protein
MILNRLKTRISNPCFDDVSKLQFLYYMSDKSYLELIFLDGITQYKYLQISVLAQNRNPFSKSSKYIASICEYNKV